MRPVRQRTTTVAGMRRPHAAGRSTQRAAAGAPPVTTWLAAPSVSTTVGSGTRRNTTSSTGSDSDTESSTSSPSKQRSGDTLIVAPVVSGMPPRGATARAASAGVASSSRAACRVRMAATSARTATVPSRPSRGAARHSTTCVSPGSPRPGDVTACGCIRGRPYLGPAPSGQITRTGRGAPSLLASAIRVRGRKCVWPPRQSQAERRFGHGMSYQ